MVPVRYAICNEMFKGREHGRVAETVSRMGYRGAELAPFTLSGEPLRMPKEARLLVRRAFEDAGVAVIGLHWLLAKTEGLHITSPDDAARGRALDHLSGLVELCNDLGGGVMVFGSPAQRSVAPGGDPAAAFARARDLFRVLAPKAGNAGVTICFEPLTPKETNFVTTMREGVALVEAVGHPAFQLHLDVKAMAGAEAKPPADIIREEGGRHLRHFHANDPNLLGPGMGDFDFSAVARALKDIRYDGWVSVETFVDGPGPEETARRSIETMKTAFGEE
jgi:sugar phosphate isomerase/epimerase